MSELELKLGEKDSEVVQLNSEIKSLKDQLSEVDTSLKNQIISFESNLNKERALVKNLRQQVRSVFLCCNLTQNVSVNLQQYFLKYVSHNSKALVNFI